MRATRGAAAIKTIQVFATVEYTQKGVNRKHALGNGEISPSVQNVGHCRTSASNKRIVAQGITPKPYQSGEKRKGPKLSRLTTARWRELCAMKQETMGNAMTSTSSPWSWQ